MIVGEVASSSVVHHVSNGCFYTLSSLSRWDLRARGVARCLNLNENLNELSLPSSNRKHKERKIHILSRVSIAIHAGEEWIACYTSSASLQSEMKRLRGRRTRRR